MEAVEYICMYKCMSYVYATKIKDDVINLRGSRDTRVERKKVNEMNITFRYEII